ncbi:hypothetical protein DWUX_983 [Desulfovibrio diazotrophicus]|nr:hypothetical protein DWUX_983 [Desulfovibrio diazotrophicus]VVU43219.1 hypothetical protein DWUX_565 [Desulfovibrio diazotrophicus]
MEANLYGLFFALAAMSPMTEKRKDTRLRRGQ